MKVTPGILPEKATAQSPEKHKGTESTDCAAIGNLVVEQASQVTDSSDCAAVGNPVQQWASVTIVASNAIKSCIKNPQNIKRVANRTNGNLGRCNRYRLNDASFSIYHLGEREEADKASDLTLPRESIRYAINAAAGSNRISAHTDWPTRQARDHTGPVVPAYDGR